MLTLAALAEKAEWTWTDSHGDKKHRADLEVTLTAVKVNLSGADLRNVDLRKSNLRHACLTHTNFAQADLRHVDLRYADLTYADLRSANLTDALLNKANLNNANLIAADLTHANLTDAHLAGAHFMGARVRKMMDPHKHANQLRFSRFSRDSMPNPRSGSGTETDSQSHGCLARMIYLPASVRVYLCLTPCDSAEASMGCTRLCASTWS